MNSLSKARRGPITACCALLLVVALPAHAQSNWYVAPEISYFYPDRMVFDDSDVSLGISAGRSMGGGLRLELGYHALRLVPQDKPGLVKQYSAHVAALSERPLSERWSTYVGLGLGASRTEFNGTLSTLPYVTVGAGLSWAIPGVRNLQLDQEFRTRYSYDEDERLGDADLIDGQLLLRLRYAFGAANGAKPKNEDPPVIGPAGDLETAPAVERDADGDGVPDSRDRCPNTIPGVRVDADGCMIRG